MNVPYEAPQGRRVNAIGAHVTDGPEAGRFEYQSWAVLPKSRAKQPRKTPEERAAAQGLTLDEVGPIDAARVLDFIWRIAGRPATAPEEWKRIRPLLVVLDNYTVHRCELVEAAVPALTAADVHLVYLPKYCPELSAIEPDWNDVKQHHLPQRSFERVAELKRAVDAALAERAAELQQAHAKTTNVHQSTT
jgi:hypothetical protein